MKRSENLWDLEGLKIPISKLVKVHRWTELFGQKIKMCRFLQLEILGRRCGRSVYADKRFWRLPSPIKVAGRSAFSLRVWSRSAQPWSDEGSALTALRSTAASSLGDFPRGSTRVPDSVESRVVRPPQSDCFQSCARRSSRDRLASGYRTSQAHPQCVATVARGFAVKHRAT